MLSACWPPSHQWASLQSTKCMFSWPLCTVSGSTVLNPNPADQLDPLILIHFTSIKILILFFTISPFFLSFSFGTYVIIRNFHQNPLHCITRFNCSRPQSCQSTLSSLMSKWRPSWRNLLPRREGGGEGVRSNIVPTLYHFHQTHLPT